MKRILAFLLVLIMCLPLIASCKKDEQPAEDETVVGVPMPVIAGDASEYVLVYSVGEGNMKNVPYAVAKLIQDAVRAVTGVTMTIAQDSSAPQAKEILIGTDLRADSYTSPVSKENYGEGYSVFVAGDKIVLEAGSKPGMYFAAYAFVKELLGVDLQSNPQPSRDEGRTEFSVLSTYAATQFLVCGELPYMNIPLEQFSVCYDSTNYIQMRAAITLQQEIKDYDSVILEKVNHSWAKDDKPYFYFEQDNSLADGGFKFRTEGNRVILSAKDYFGYTSAVRLVMKLRKDLGFYPFRDSEGQSGTYLDHLETYEEVARYAFEPTSEYRVMFYNVLCDNTEVVERAKLQTEMIGVYQPDTVGFQEFHERRRSAVVPLLQKLGYAEAMDYKQGNMISPSYGEGTSSKLYNMVPIFYKTATTKCLDSGFLRYKAQVGEAESASKTLSWALLESKSSGEQYLVLNTHMCTQDDSIRGKQANEVLELVDGLLSRYNVPVFLGGDYNGKYTHANYIRFSQNGFTDVEKNNLATLFTSKLRTYHRPYPEYNASIGLMWPAGGDDSGMIDPASSVDHIMIKNADSVDVSVYGVVVDDCTISGGDHFPIFIDFSIK